MRFFSCRRFLSHLKFYLPALFHRSYEIGDDRQKGDNIVGIFHKRKIERHKKKLFQRLDMPAAFDQFLLPYFKGLNQLTGMLWSFFRNSHIIAHEKLFALRPRLQPHLTAVAAAGEGIGHNKTIKKKGNPKSTQKAKSRAENSRFCSLAFRF